MLSTLLNDLHFLLNAGLGALVLLSLLIWCCTALYAAAWIVRWFWRYYHRQSRQFNRYVAGGGGLGFHGNVGHFFTLFVIVIVVVLLIAMLTDRGPRS
jgi:hypothetical protein